MREHDLSRSSGPEGEQRGEKAKGEKRPQNGRVNPIKKWCNRTERLSPNSIQEEAERKFYDQEHKRERQERRRLTSSSLESKIVSLSLGDLPSSRLERMPEISEKGIKEEDKKHTENQDIYRKALEWKIRLKKEEFRVANKLVESHIINNIGKEEKIENIASRKGEIISDNPKSMSNLFNREIRKNDLKRQLLAAERLTLRCWQIQYEGGKYRQVQVNEALLELKLKSIWESDSKPLPAKPSELNIEDKGKAPEGTVDEKKSELAGIYSLRLEDFKNLAKQLVAERTSEPSPDAEEGVSPSRTSLIERAEEGVSPPEGASEGDTKQARKLFLEWYRNRNQKILEKLGKEVEIEEALIERDNLEPQRTDLKSGCEILEGQLDKPPHGGLKDQWNKFIQNRLHATQEALANVELGYLEKGKHITKLKEALGQVNEQLEDLEGQPYADLMRDAQGRGKEGQDRGDTESNKDDKDTKFKRAKDRWKGLTERKEAKASGAESEIASSVGISRKGRWENFNKWRGDVNTGIQELWRTSLRRSQEKEPNGEHGTVTSSDVKKGVKKPMRLLQFFNTNARKENNNENVDNSSIEGPSDHKTQKKNALSDRKWGGISIGWQTGFKGEIEVDKKKLVTNDAETDYEKIDDEGLQKRIQAKSREAVTALVAYRKSKNANGADSGQKWREYNTKIEEQMRNLEESKCRNQLPKDFDKKRLEAIITKEADKKVKLNLESIQE